MFPLFEFSATLNGKHAVRKPCVHKNNYTATACCNWRKDTGANTTLMLSVVLAMVLGGFLLINKQTYDFVVYLHLFISCFAYKIKKMKIEEGHI